MTWPVCTHCHQNIYETDACEEEHDEHCVFCGQKLCEHAEEFTASS